MRRDPADVEVPVTVHRTLRATDASTPVTSVIGLAVFLGFLFTASQVLVHLHAVTLTSAVVADEARRVAASRDGCADADVRVRSRLGTWRDRAEVGCAASGVDVVVSVRGPSPARGLAWLPAVGELERVAVVPVVQPPT